MVTEQRPRRRPSRRRFFVGIAALLVVGFGLIYGLHFAFNPWAFTFFGRSALVGYWQGEVSYGPGDNRQFALRLDDDMPTGRASCGNCPNISGAARVCGADHNARYEVYGDTENYRGTRFSLNARRDETEGPGLYLGQLDGVWDGHDMLTVSSSLVRIYPDGSARSTTSTDTRTGVTTSDTPTVRVELRRANEADFNGACR